MPCWRNLGGTRGGPPYKNMAVPAFFMFFHLFGSLWLIRTYTIWRFPELGVPPDIIHFHVLFHYKPSILGGTITYGKPHIKSDHPRPPEDPITAAWAELFTQELWTINENNDALWWLELAKSFLHIYIYIHTPIYTYIFIYIYDYICISYI